MNRLESIASRLISHDPATKALRCYAEYDDYFRKNCFAPSRILEIGVHKGESTKVLSHGFPDAKIIAIDLELQPIDFSECRNVKYLQCDQTDIPRLEAIIRREFPDGVDLILDDASHVGSWSATTFFGTYPFLKSGGLYIIEDWGTGYLDGWVDGGRYQEPHWSTDDGSICRRLPSHDFGMVGFVKALVDLAHDPVIREGLVGMTQRISQIRSIEFTEGMCFVLKH